VFSKGDARGNYEGGLGIRTAREAIFRWQQKKFLFGRGDQYQFSPVTFLSIKTIKPKFCKIQKIKLKPVPTDQFQFDSVILY
jgi:hypothetical protein